MTRLGARYWSDGAAGPLLRIVMSATAENARWMDLALCREVDPDLFFPEQNDGGDRSTPAKRICMGCDVKAQCLEYALANDERFGIFGGLSERQRREIKRKREREAQAA